MAFTSRIKIPFLKTRLNPRLQTSCRHLSPKFLSFARIKGLQDYKINSSLTSHLSLYVNKEPTGLVFWSIRLFSMSANTNSSVPWENWFISMSNGDFLLLPIFTVLPSAVKPELRGAPLRAGRRNGLRPQRSPLKAGNTPLWPGLLKSIWHAVEEGSRWWSIVISIFFFIA